MNQKPPHLTDQTVQVDQPVWSRLSCLKVSILSGEHQGQQVYLRQRKNLIGSGLHCHLTLQDEAVSKNHLEVILERDSYLLRDLDSKNGSYIDSVRILQVRVHHAVTLKVGRTTIKIEPTGDRTEGKTTAEPRFGKALGQSALMQNMFAMLREAATSDSSILLQGETGTGKELLAKAIHDHSKRKDKPFVVLDCGALPTSIAERELFGHVKGAFTSAVASAPGIFEKADGGTLFIDEIGELPLELQPKFLRAIEYQEIQPLGSEEKKRVNVRIVSATNRSLLHEVNHRNFREDLYYRINVLEVDVPPLRDRQDDILLLATTFLKEILANDHPNYVDGMENDIIRNNASKLLHYRWPGNIRELKNRMERLALKITHPNATDFNLSLSLDEIETHPIENLCEQFVEKKTSFRDAKAATIALFETHYLKKLLNRHDGNVSAAARACGMDRRNFQKLLRKYES